VRAPLLAFLAAAAAVVLAGCGSTGMVAAGGDVGTGKTLFQQNCASCHTLADANATGAVGPNLDEAFGMPGKQGFEQSTIRDVVRGQIAYASPPMPRDLVTGEQADAVAAYVAQVAGQPVQGNGVQASPLPGSSTPTSTTAQTATTQTATTGGAGAGTSTPAGKEIFTANCAACHTLADAGATGSVGPNLDQLKPAEDVVAHQVEVGGGAMPSFKGTLTPQQIQDVAAYVASVAG